MNLDQAWMMVWATSSSSRDNPTNSTMSCVPFQIATALDVIALEKGNCRYFIGVEQNQHGISLFQKQMLTKNENQSYKHIKT